MRAHGLHGAKMWVSPYMRARMTAQFMLKEMLAKDDAGEAEGAGAASGEGGGGRAHACPGDSPDKLVVAVRETPLLVEQDWGTVEGTAREHFKERHGELHQRSTTQRKYPGGMFYARMSVLFLVFYSCPLCVPLVLCRLLRGSVEDRASAAALIVRPNRAAKA